MRFMVVGHVIAISLLGLVLPGIVLADDSKLPLIVCSTTQVADFCRQVVGDRCEVKCILEPGQDPHLYETKQSDAELVRRADLCLENGWHLEGKDWLRTLAKEYGKKVVSCVEGVAPYQLKEGGVEVADPHAWFTPQNAAIYVRNILKAVCELDPPHKAEYEARAELYGQQLRTLHAWMVRQISVIPTQRRVLVTSHDAFNYFCIQYGLKPHSPAGWSTGQEVGGGITPQRLRETVESIRSTGVKAIFVETSVNDKVIRQIADEAGVRIGGSLYSDSMGVRGSAGESYIGMMRENVLTIVEGLK